MTRAPESMKRSPDVAQPLTTDVCVYGGTSGAAIAAVQVARMGMRAILLSPVRHLGGMCVSGLGFVDLGSERALGGLSREFFQLLYRHYQNDSAWIWQKRDTFHNAGQNFEAFNADHLLATVFEPRVAEKIFLEMLRKAGVRVMTGQLDRETGVSKTGAKIVSIRTGGGTEIRAAVFIDATYEGDLLAGAGVSHTIGRESNTTYAESVNGIQAGRSRENQLPDGVCPYVLKGDPTSGLLPHVNASAGGSDGTGDKRLQAYCYRMVLTDVPENRVVVEKPENYSERDYEILFRSIEAGQTRVPFFKFSMVPNRKTDSNNSCGISCDAIGGNFGENWNYAEASYAMRAEVDKAHENWQRGLIWTLQNHPRVPRELRGFYSKWGLPMDEFPDNHHWPYDIYVREGRRMVSDYVMTEHNCTGGIIADDPIALGSYTMDSHHTQRYVTPEGHLKNEGDIQLEVTKPYPIAYRAIIPKASECTNLLVPWALSASHMAFGSIRMEPVFMMLAQSAATAACLSIIEGETVQQVPYSKLRDRLQKDGQVLSLEAP